MRSVSIVINARLSSSRLPNKLILPFCGSSLIERALDKLSRIKVENKYLAAYDQELLDVYQPYSNRVGLLKRDADSVSKGMVPHTVAFKHFGDVPDKYIMIFNPCHPFVEPAVYESAISQFCSSTSQSMTSVVQKSNIFFDHHHNVINSDAETEVQTHKQHLVYEMAHAFHIIDRDRFLSDGTMWGYGDSDPELFVVDKMAALDIDDEDDFNICQQIGCLYKVRGKKTPSLVEGDELPQLKELKITPFSQRSS